MREGARGEPAREVLVAPALVGLVGIWGECWARPGPFPGATPQATMGARTPSGSPPECGESRRPRSFALNTLDVAQAAANSRESCGAHPENCNTWTRARELNPTPHPPPRPQ